MKFSQKTKGLSTPRQRNTVRRPITIAKRTNVSMVNAEFKVVHLSVKKGAPKINTLLPHYAPPQHNHKHPQNLYNLSHSDDSDGPNEFPHLQSGLNKHHSGDDNHHHRSTTPQQSSMFIPSNIFKDSDALLKYAEKHQNATFFVKRSDLEQFYIQNPQQLSLEGTGQRDETSRLSLTHQPSLSQSSRHGVQHQPSHQAAVSPTTPAMSNAQTTSNVLSLLSDITTVKLDTIVSEHNVERRRFFESSPSKQLELFDLPRPYETDFILAASRGDLNTVKQIVYLSYYITLSKMKLLPPDLMGNGQTKTNNNNNNNNNQQNNTNNNNNIDWTTIPTDFNTLNTLSNQSTSSKPSMNKIIDDNDSDDTTTTTKHKLKHSKQLTMYHIFNQQQLTMFEQYFNTLPQPILQLIRSSDFFEFNINSQLQKGGSCLHHASLYGDVNVVEFLIKHGANVNLRTSNNSTPLHWSAGAGLLPIVEMLCEKYGASTEVQTSTWCVDVFGRSSGQYAIHWASASGFRDVVEYLHNKNPLLIGYVDEKDNTGVDLAKKGLHFNTTKCIKSLLEEEYVPVDINIYTKKHNMFVDSQQYTKHLQNNNNNNNNNTNNTQQDYDYRLLDDSNTVDVDHILHNLSNSNNNNHSSSEESSYDASPYQILINNGRRLVAPVLH